jgi:sugar phosphate isomerase/epimerase
VVFGFLATLFNPTIAGQGMEWRLSTHLFLHQPLDEELFGLIHGLGVTSIELWGMRPHFDYEQPAEARRLAKAAARQGIAIGSVHAPFYTHVNQLYQGNTLSLAASATSAREAALAHTERVLDVMGILGAELLVVHAGDLEDDYSAAKLNNLSRSLKRLLPRLQAKGIKLALENINTPLSTTVHLLELLEPFDPDWVGVCLDVGHAQLNEDVGQAILSCGSRLMGVHVSDNDGKSDSHFVPGEGVIDWKNVINMLLNVCYTGVLTLELRQYGELEAFMDKVKRGIANRFDLNFFADQENRH